MLVTIQITSNYTEQRTLALRPARLPSRTDDDGSCVITPPKATPNRSTNVAPSPEHY